MNDILDHSLSVTVAHGKVQKGLKNIVVMSSTSQRDENKWAIEDMAGAWFPHIWRLKGHILRPQNIID